MKKRILLLAMFGGLAVASCKKTYVCKDQTGNVTAEVEASSLSNANRLCEANNQHPMTATEK